MFSTAALAAPEWTLPGIPLWGERVTLRTLPPPWGMKALVAAAWVISQVPMTLRSITVLKPFGLIASAGLRNWPPALLTRTSRRPCRSRRPSTNRPTGSSSRMSSVSCVAEPLLEEGGAAKCGPAKPTGGAGSSHYVHVSVLPSPSVYVAVASRSSAAFSPPSFSL